MKLTGRPLIYLISDGSIEDGNYEASSAVLLNLLQSAVAAHIPLAQIREKRLSARLLYDLAKKAASISLNSRTKILVNDRADVALAAGADGVHLTLRSVVPEAVKSHFPPDFIVGMSTHSLEELDSAVKGGADFAVFGPVFESPGKSPALGLDTVRDAAEEFSGFPVLALGGIDGDNYKEVIECGAAGFAAIRFLNDKESLESLQKEFEL